MILESVCITNILHGLNHLHYVRLQSHFKLLCHGVKHEGGEDVEYPIAINCDKGLEVRRKVNGPSKSRNTP